MIPWCKSHRPRLNEEGAIGAEGPVLSLSKYLMYSMLYIVHCVTEPHYQISTPHTPRPPQNYDKDGLGQT